jgi:hypothetical protein
MLSFRRIAVTTAAVAALAAPTVAQARPDITPATQPTTIDKVSPDARYGVPDETTPTVVTVPRTEVVEADDGFAWGDALIGGGAVLLLTAVLGGSAIAIRPRHSAAH